MYRAAASTDPADWVVSGLRAFGEHSALSLVPAGFSVYVRVFHPAYRVTGSERTTVSWAQVARANGRRMHADVQIGSITGSERYEQEGQAGVFDEAPETGSVPPELLPELASVLARHTATPTHGYFAVWFGFGALPPQIAAAPTFTVPAREYHLLTGPVEAANDVAADLGPGISPNLWWPDDHAWCVATDIDLKSTYIGADQRCADELVSTPHVEAYGVSPESRIDWLSDPLNPRPARD